MADETQTGQQTATPNAPVVNMMTELPGVPSDPAVPTPTPPPSGGRSVEELFNEMQELKRANAELAEKASRAEHEATYTRTLIDTLRPGVQQQQEPPAIPDITDDEFLSNPGKAIDRKISSLFEREKAERDREKREAYVERAKSLFETGSKTAAEKLGKLMSGIEPEVKQYVQQGIISGTIDPEAAMNPELWASTALVLRYVKGERSFDKYLGEPRQGMSPTYTETPTAGTPPQAGPVLSEDDKRMARIFKVTDEAWAATKAKMGMER
jgi:hypothetical protein